MITTYKKLATLAVTIG
jgi:hypothetical protein